MNRGRIVETEAYLGPEDPAAHSFGGKPTPRTTVMYGDPGFSYIYFIYGMHFCFNVVTMPNGTPEAVLIRALEPLEGVRPESLANGPGKLCAALKLDKGQNALDLCRGQTVWIEAPNSQEKFTIVEGPRVGIGNTHDAVHWPLRFGIARHPALSKVKFPNYKE